ncbi:hypothetical protein ACFSTE_04190 [Aquimarina hainanensis]|uniref:Uncharacterized protein n=1 Tax=Aquimarina hainanensis TaxID=1578017 RepID=A0ABW5N4J3_9FLAO
MLLNYNQKEANYLTIILTLLNAFIYLYIGYETHRFIARTILLLGLIPSFFSIIAVSLPKLRASLTPEEIKYAHRPGIIAIVGLMIMNFQIISNSIISNNGIAIFIFFSNSICISLLFFTIFSKKANNYTPLEFYKQNQSHLYKIAVFIAVFSMINTMVMSIRYMEITPLLANLIFFIPLFFTAYQKKRVTKKIYHIVLICLLLILLSFTIVVAFQDHQTPLSICLYFILTLALLIFHIYAIKIYTSTKCISI